MRPYCTSQVVLVIDGLDALRPAHGALTLDWLPPTSRMPPGLVLLASANMAGQGDALPDDMVVDDRVLDTLQRRGCSLVYARRLGRGVAQASVASLLWRYGKKLDDAQVSAGAGGGEGVGCTDC